MKIFLEINAKGHCFDQPKLRKRPTTFAELFEFNAYVKDRSLRTEDGLSENKHDDDSRMGFTSLQFYNKNSR